MKQKLLTKLLTLVLLTLGGVINPAWGEIVKYTISSKNTLSTTGTAPEGSSASIVETYSTSKQMTKTNSQTLTLKGWDGYTISNITLSMKSNGSGGAGNLSYSTDSGTTFTYIVGSNGTGVNFNDSRWYNAWSTEYVNISKDVEIEASSSDIVIKIYATANSLYCLSYQITYDVSSSSSAEATTTTIDASGITNTNKFVGTSAGSLSATVKDESETAVAGAEVTWTSSDTDVATINSEGEVTLVAAGTITITASYAGEDGVYKSSLDTYELVVVDEDPTLTTIWSEDFSEYAADDIPSGGTYSYACANGGSTTKVYSQNSAGGTSPELLVSKSSGSFTAVIPLLYPAYAYSGNLTLTFKSNANNINVKTTTDGLAVSGEESSGAGVTFSTPDTHKVSFTGITNSTENITIVFTATSSSNVRLDDIVLKGKQAELPYVATPVITPTSGAVVSGQEVTISCATDGASIYYTTDGTNPSSSSTLYNPESKPTITAETTIKAIGIKDGLTNSSVAEASFTIAAPCATPTFSVAAGDVVKGTTVTIACATDGATIYYTTNGDEPTTSSSVYSTALTINATQTIKAIATKDGNANSAVASVSYTVQDYTSLPFEWAGGINSDLAALTGVTIDGLGDYAAQNAPYRIKMDGVGDYIQVKTNAQPGKVYVGVKMIGGATTSKIKVQESADGTSFTDVEEFTIKGSQNDILNFETSNSFAATTRYVKIIKSVHGSNVGVGPITITGCEAVTVTSAGYATYASTSPLDFTGKDIKAYIAEQNGTTGVTFTQVNKVPANTGVLLYKDGGATEVIPVFDGAADDVTGNVFVPGTGAAVASEDGDYRNYILNKPSEKPIGFYKAASQTVAKNRAYIHIDASAPIKEFIALPDFEDDATSIQNSKFEIQNEEAPIYNLAGQRLNKMQKGINIVNGKKIMVK